MGNNFISNLNNNLPVTTNNVRSSANMNSHVQNFPTMVPGIPASNILGAGMSCTNNINPLSRQFSSTNSSLVAPQNMQTVNAVPVHNVVQQINPAHMQTCSSNSNCSNLNTNANAINANNFGLNANLTMIPPTLDITKFVPVFDGTTVHPVIFLNRLEQVMLTYNLSFDSVPFWGQTLFKGEGKIWSDAIMFSVPDWNTFKSLFLDYFWNSEKQCETRSQIETGRYKASDGTYCSYFLKMVAKARFLQPAYEECMLISIIARHFPATVASSLIGATYFNEALQRLRQAEFIMRRGPERTVEAGFRNPPAFPRPGMNGMNPSASGPLRRISALEIEPIPEGDDVHQSGNEVASFM